MPSGRLAANLMHFARRLRAAGLPIGSDRIEVVLRALAATSAPAADWRGRPDDFQAILATCMVSGPDQRAIFDRIFDGFWREPESTASVPSGGTTPGDSASLADAARDPHGVPVSQTRENQAGQGHDAARILATSGRDALMQKDFGAMDQEERLAAQRILQSLHLAFERLPTRRRIRASRPGTVDWRATLASMGRHGGELHRVRWRRRKILPAPLVVVADMSESMSVYARMLLVFAHALGRVAAARVETFVFGTRLVRVTPHMRHRDPARAIADVAAAMEHWSGGTHIADSLRSLNREWRGCALDSRATVLLITDGLERGHAADLAREAAFLRRSCRRLLWLNPLARYAGFEPRTPSMRAIGAHADCLLPAHNVQTLQDLAALLVDGVSTPRRPTASGRR